MPRMVLLPCRIVSLSLLLLAAAAGTDAGAGPAGAAAPAYRCLGQPAPGLRAALVRRGRTCACRNTGARSCCSRSSAVAAGSAVRSWLRSAASSRPTARPVSPRSRSMSTTTRTLRANSSRRTRPRCRCCSIRKNPSPAQYRVDNLPMLLIIDRSGADPRMSTATTAVRTTRSTSNRSRYSSTNRLQGPLHHETTDLPVCHNPCPARRAPVSRRPRRQGLGAA